MHGLWREGQVLLLALQFLTRVPVPAGTWDPRLMRHAVRHFPLVGALVGAIGAAVAVLAVAWWSPAVAAMLAVAATAWLTVALHEDGLADTCDALLGAAPRTQALAILKDSRIGTYGAVALALALGLRVLLLAELLTRDPRLAVAALVASHAGGRALAVALMAVLPDARDDTTAAKAPATTAPVAPLDTAWALASGLVLLALPVLAAGAPALRWAVLAAELALLALALRTWLRRRLGGRTGDTLGAAEQLGEIVVLLVWAAA